MEGVDLPAAEVQDQGLSLGSGCLGERAQLLLKLAERHLVGHAVRGRLERSEVDACGAAVARGIAKLRARVPAMMTKEGSDLPSPMMWVGVCCAALLLRHLNLLRSEQQQVPTCNGHPRQH